MVKKERSRYIIFKIIKEENVHFEKREFLKLVWQSIWKYFGIKEANKIGLWLIDLNLEKNFVIIRCTHKTKEILITALTFLNEINEKRVILSPIKSTGTIKSMQKVKNHIFK